MWSARDSRCRVDAVVNKLPADHAHQLRAQNFRPMVLCPTIRAEPLYWAPVAGNSGGAVSAFLSRKVTRPATGGDLSRRGSHIGVVSGGEHVLPFSSDFLAFL